MTPESKKLMLRCRLLTTRNVRRRVRAYVRWLNRSGTSIQYTAGARIELSLINFWNIQARLTISSTTNTWNSCIQELCITLREGSVKWVMTTQKPSSSTIKVGSSLTMWRQLSSRNWPRNCWPRVNLNLITRCGTLKAKLKVESCPSGCSRINRNNVSIKDYCRDWMSWNSNQRGITVREWLLYL